MQPANAVYGSGFGAFLRDSREDAPNDPRIPDMVLADLPNLKGPRTQIIGF